MATFNNEKERQEYLSLSSEERRRYDMEQDIDPSLSHSDLLQLVYINKKIGDLKRGGRDVSSEDPSLISEILKGMREWLKKFPDIFYEVVDSIDAALDYLGDLIWKGIKWIGETIWDLLDRFF